MADAVVGFLARSLLEKAISLAADEISLSLGVNKELKKLADRLELIEALVSDAQNKQLDSKAVEHWLKKLKSIALDARIVLDDYGYEVLRQRIHCRKRDKVLGLFSSSNPLYFRSSIGHKIRDVLSSLDEAYAESNQIGLQAVGLISSLPDLNKANRLTDPFVEESEIVGRDDDALKVISLLIDSDYRKDLPVVTILGMGGQGKTTLAQLVYKDEKVGSYFDKKVWICVSDDFVVERLLAQILESLTQNTCQLSTREGLVNKLKEELKDKTYLLVLDDVWNESRDEWDVMRRCLLEIGGSKGSKVMATTRSEDVASAMQTSGYHRLQILSEDQSLALFERCAFAEGGATRSPELIEIAKRILKKCGGVPLAIKAVGGLLYTRDSELEWSMIERSELWSIGGSGVLSAIKLSYDHLPSLSLKQCFAYCAIYPKDTELEKDILVQHWMAQGFLNPPKGSQLQMEDIGNMYFNVLLKRSLLQEAKSSWTNELAWKMHDLVHDFSLQVSETFRVDVNKGKVGSCGMDVVHLQVKINSYRERLPNSFKSTVPSNLRTLSLSGFYLHDGWFENFRCLTVLTIHFWNLEKLPKAIGKIKHLRFLDFYGPRVCKLPKSIVKLYYLETLRYGGHLSGLPLGFDNLINLRHLICSSDSRAFLIPGLSQMTNIQTIPFFKVDKSKGFQIEELEHLDNLTGKLRIFGLENVSGCESASRSKLSNKSRIHTLELHWEKREHDCNDTEVMKSLRPHSHVKMLTIDGYQGPHLPSWIILLRYLTRVALSDLDKCEQLPSFGELPCLQFLAINSLPKLKCIGKEFYGSYSNGAEISIFPALKELRLSDMGSLEEWSDVFLTAPSSAKAFPSLEMGFFLRLPNLSVFPNLGSLPCLQRLIMYFCPKLALQPNWNVPDETHISLHSSVNINSNRDVPYLPSLHFLKLVYCDKMFCNLNIFAALKILHITGDASLWPKDMRNLINLESLVLSPPEKTDSFPLPYSVSAATACLGDIKYPVSLRTLCLGGWSNITSLPDQIQHLKTLRMLSIDNFEGLEALPEWLCNMKCLEELSIRECNNLKQFPSAGALKCLSNLKCLYVTACPLLEERYAKEGCPERHMIAHIPKIVFESRQ